MNIQAVGVSDWHSFWESYQDGRVEIGQYIVRETDAFDTKGSI
jgi:hypothetical protein